MSETPRIAAVLWDADGVLQRSAPGFLDAVRELCGDTARTDVFVREVFEAEKPALTGEQDFPQALAGLLARWSSSVPVVEALELWKMIEPDAAAFERVRRVRSAGTVVALATNQQAHRASLMLEGLSYAREFDHVFCSYRIGWAKPSREYFRHALDVLALPADRVLFIDDHDRNVAAAQAEGLCAARFHLDEGMAALDALLARHGLSP